MSIVVHWVEALIQAIPIPIIEVWGRFSFIIGLPLAIFAFSGFSFRNGKEWRISRELNAWNFKSFLSFFITFILIFITGYLGSFFILVPGAQTFESLKDLSVLICILFFGYPALLAVPFAYGLSDLIEGVPPEFLWDWILGYFINPTFFWISYQLIGKNPDFKKISVWIYYIFFVFVFLILEPFLWGYLCSKQFGADISYVTITSALLFTTGITFLISPFVILILYPGVQKLGLFWAKIPEQVAEQSLFGNPRVWISGPNSEEEGSSLNSSLWKESGIKFGMPVQMFLVVPFILMVLLLIGLTAYFSLKNAEKSAMKLTEALHIEWAENINLTLDTYFLENEVKDEDITRIQIQNLLKKAKVNRAGKLYVLKNNWEPYFKLSPEEKSSPIYLTLYTELLVRGKKDTVGLQHLQFPVVTKSPLFRETWYAIVSPYSDPKGNVSLSIVTLFPASFYLEGVRTGSSDSAMVFAWALVFTLFLTAALAKIVVTPILKVTSAVVSFAEGDLESRVPESKLGELMVLSRAYNRMASELQASFKKTKENERVILDLNANLEKKVLERTNELSKTNQELKETIAAKEKLFHDLTSAQDQLLISEKLATLGQLAAGMTHELNTPLGAIKSSARALQKILENEMVHLPNFYVSLSIPKRELFMKLFFVSIQQTNLSGGLVSRMVKKDWIQRCINRGIDEPEQKIEEAINLGLLVLEDELVSILAEDGILPILQKLNSFTNLYRMSHVIELATGKASHVVDALKQYLKGDNQKSNFDISNVNIASEMDAILTLYHSRIKYDVEVVKNYPKEVYCFVDREKINQVWINLINNALQAMNYKGRLEIMMEIKDDKVVVSIRDSGEGIPMEIQKKIFSPFFTTKKHGEGIGLGLDICKKIVENVKGRIEFRSEPGDTVFQVELPQSQNRKVL